MQGNHELGRQAVQTYASLVHAADLPSGMARDHAMQSHLRWISAEQIVLDGDCHQLLLLMAPTVHSSGRPSLRAGTLAHTGMIGIERCCMRPSPPASSDWQAAQRVWLSIPKRCAGYQATGREHLGNRIVLVPSEETCWRNSVLSLTATG